jgi:hypothetical protein
MSDDLRVFVREALARGIARDAIRAQLADAGWRADEIDHALNAWADAAFPIPVPRRRPYLSAHETFLYLVLFVTLYLTAYHVGAIGFALVDHGLPDPARRFGELDAARRRVRDSVAWLLVAWPVYLALSAVIGRMLRREPAQRESRIRKWLTYATLFVAALVILGDLVQLVIRLLSGELPPRFLAKTAIVALIAGWVFGRFLVQVRREDARADGAVRTSGVLPRVAAAAVLAVLVAGFVLAGSPGEARRQELDARRLEALQGLSAAVEQYHRDFGVLPPSVDSAVTVTRLMPVPPRDPVTGTPFEYAAVDSTHYTLCATFDAADSTGGALPAWRTEPARPGGRVRALWAHGAGRTCFDMVVPPRPR